MQSPQLHPYDAFVVLARLVGHLSVFHEDLVPGVLPEYDHDRPGQTFEQIRAKLNVLLEALRPVHYVKRVFERKRDNMNRDGLQVTLDRSWIDENLELYVALESTEMDINELEKFIYQNLDVKLASPTRAPRIANIAVRGLRMQIKTVPAGTLPRKHGLHYFKIDKTIGPDRTDYWKECEQERGIRMGMREGQFAAMEKFKPALYVPQKDR
jgi:type VI secretion system protein ImpJ